MPQKGLTPHKLLGTCRLPTSRSCTWLSTAYFIRSLSPTAEQRLHAVVHLPRFELNYVCHVRYRLASQGCLRGNQLALLSRNQPESLVNWRGSNLSSGSCRFFPDGPRGRLLTNTAAHIAMTRSTEYMICYVMYVYTSSYTLSFCGRLLTFMPWSSYKQEH